MTGASAKVLPLVEADLRARVEKGTREYGEPLTTHNGRDALQDAYEEALDMSMYLRQAIAERDAIGTPRSDRIELADLPNEMIDLAERMARVGAAIRYYGGFGPFAEWGDMLETQSAPMCRRVGQELAKMRGANA